MKVKCPKCNTRLNSPPSLAGKRAKCPNCGQVLLLRTARKVPSTKTMADSAPGSKSHLAKQGRSSMKLDHKTMTNDELHRVLNYRLVRKTLRPAGIGSIVFGLVAKGTGFGGMEANPINAILGLIGIFLFVEGIWIVAAPTPAGMIVDGIALIILGIWNIIITFANSAAVGGGGHRFFAVLGVWQIIWGFQSFGRYKRFSAMPMSRPSDETLRQIDDMVKELAKTKPKDATDVIAFQIKNRPWKGRLGQDSGIFVDAPGQEVVFVNRDRVRIEIQDKVLIGKALKASFTLGDRNLNGTISLESYERYDAWKAGNPLPNRVAAGLTSPA